MSEMRTSAPRNGNPITPPRPAGIDLYWLPLGAGGHSVRVNGKVFEAVAAGIDRRDQ